MTLESLSQPISASAADPTEGYSGGAEGQPCIFLAVLPGVIISTCGFLSLAFYGRLTAVVSRLRGFQREILVEQEKLERTSAVEEARLLEVLGTQTEQLKRRAPHPHRPDVLFERGRFTHHLQLDSCVHLVHARSRSACRRVFRLRAVSMLCGIMAALMELRDALEPVELEARFV